MPLNVDRYGRFVSENADKAGVSAAAARGSGVDPGEFEQVAAQGIVEGQLVLKVWASRGGRRLLWCYVGNPNGGWSFPLFPRTKPYEAASKCPLGTQVLVDFEQTGPGGPWCTSFHRIGGRADVE